VIIRVICKVTLSLGLLLPPIPSFSGIRKVRKFIKSQDEILKLSINAQGSRVIIIVVHVGAGKIYVAVQWRHSGKRKDRMKLSLPPKLMVF
jgi:hypothetical protein